MASFEFWRKWLLVVCGLIVLFGLAMAFLSWSPLFSVFNDMANSVFWPVSGPDAGTQQLRLWYSGMLGGTMAGWGVTLWFIVNGPFRKKERWSRDAIVAGIIVWFIVDTLLSLYAKVYFNAGFNTLVLVLAGVPLIMTSKEFL